MKILLTNDDGYNAPGIQILHKMLQPHHEIILITPEPLAETMNFFQK